MSRYSAFREWVTYIVSSDLHTANTTSSAWYPLLLREKESDSFVSITRVEVLTLPPDRITSARNQAGTMTTPFQWKRLCGGWRWLQPGWSGGCALALVIGCPYQSQLRCARRVVACDIGSHCGRVIGSQAVQNVMQHLEGERFLTDTGNVDRGIALFVGQTREVPFRRQTLHGRANRAIGVSARQIQLPMHITGRC